MAPASPARAALAPRDRSPPQRSHRIAWWTTRRRSCATSSRRRRTTTTTAPPGKTGTRAGLKPGPARRHLAVCGGDPDQHHDRRSPLPAGHRQRERQDHRSHRRHGRQHQGDPDLLPRLVRRPGCHGPTWRWRCPAHRRAMDCCSRRSTTIPSPNPTAKTYDISAFISANTTVRFRIVDDLEAGDFWSVDNVTINYGTGHPTST